MKDSPFYEEAVRLVTQEEVNDKQWRIQDKIRQLEEQKAYDDNKKLQDSDCPHTNRDHWHHGREEECKACGARWSY